MSEGFKRTVLAALLCIITEISYTQGFSQNGWMIETPSRLTGREGKTTVLICKFTHPHPGYPGNITVTWKEVRANVMLYSYTNYPSLNSQNVVFENMIHQNTNERYQVLGNPRENDASIIIKQLSLHDNYQQYICLVNLSHYPNETSQSSIQTITVVPAARNDLVPVSGKKGDSATLPCAFNPPEWLSQSVTVLWMKESPDKESTILNQTRFLRAGSHYIDSVTVNEGQRYELIGNLTQGDASIRMRDLWLNDSSDYFCRVHVRIDNQENVTQDVLRLQVDAPATILELSAVRENGTGTVIVCRVVGEPFANITWVDDKGSPVHRGTTVTREPGRHQTLGKLRNPALRGTYSCVAENKHGRDSRQIDFPSTDSNYSNFIVGMLCLIPLIKFLLLLVTGIILFMKIKD
ncbi:CXADR-like membrane protein isoform X1 [Rhincodon typus]|uniref:CXADR-like membrane protein isoform X1 n=1 Tax=Rhincodon typus TaxID=259920 RepID=UPI00202EEAF2|nr:CXADR-like membrane protein isoform X1 [Rhincodon typus]